MKICSFVFSALFAVNCNFLIAQIATVPPPADSASQSKADEDQRMFKVLPNYKTVNDPSVPFIPITLKEKFRLVGHYFDPFTFAYLTGIAGIEQATDVKPGYGQGLRGYGKRYGADFTDGFTNELFVTGVFPALLHHDPRYIRKGTGSPWGRTGYALSRILITRTDAGGSAFNISEFAGNIASGAISTVYYPSDERNASGIFARTSTQLGYDSLFNVLKEFYPDISRKLSRKHRLN